MPGPIQNIDEYQAFTIWATGKYGWGMWSLDYPKIYAEWARLGKPGAPIPQVKEKPKAQQKPQSFQEGTPNWLLELYGKVPPELAKKGVPPTIKTVPTTIPAPLDKTATDYLTNLKDYLDYGARMGQNTSEQATQQLKYEMGQIQQGKTLDQLPNYTGVQSWNVYQVEGYQGTPSQKQIATWATNKYISTPGMSESEKVQLSNYKMKTGLETMKAQESADYYKSLQEDVNVVNRQGAGAGLQGRTQTGELAGHWEGEGSLLTQEGNLKYVLEGGFINPPTSAGEIANAQTKAYTQRWEEERQTELASLPEGGYNWIKRYQLENMVNPHDPGTRQSRAEQLTGATPEKLQEMLIKGMNVPTTPDWLSGMYPELIAGQPLKKTAVTTPSPQTLGKLTSGQQEQWAGYTDWTGGSYKDLLDRMQKMLPSTPIGTGSVSWLPARQRTGR